jgi:uncharacterized protein
MSPKVYFTRADIEDGEKVISNKAAKLFKEAGFAKCFRKKDFTAVKVHIGEKGNKTYIKAPCLKGLVDELISLKAKPFLTDTSTLYLGKRHNAIDHAILAHEHGFDMAGLGIPFISPDGIFGTSETIVKIDPSSQRCAEAGGVYLNKEVSVAYDIARVQSILAV